MNIKADVIIHEKASKNWLYFSNPQEIITTSKLEEVLPALQKIEQAVHQNKLHAAGFISYEASPAFDDSLAIHRTGNFPLLWFGLYAQPKISSRLIIPLLPYTLKEWRPSIRPEEYHRAIAEIKTQIAMGKTYQVNYTFRLNNSFSGDAPSLFFDLVQAQTEGYCAFIDIGTHAICSASPELFFEQHGNEITCRPMKGTIKRGYTLQEDNHQAEILKESIKNRAENVMIVDMIRNDLGQIAQTGSVKVQELFSIEKYPSLWQMTSSITAKTTADFPTIMQSLFPCASITGAPKISTMKIIQSLENSPRQIYTGTIGFLSPQRKAQFNVAIRTVLIDRQTGQAEYGTGGGVVWDSSAGDELDEAMLKAKLLTAKKPPFSILETMRWDIAEGYYLLEYHLKRMEESARYFDFPFERKIAEEYLHNAGMLLPQQTQRFRLLLNAQGELSHESTSISLPSEQLHNLKIKISDTPINANDIFLYHKTTNRTIYEKAKQRQPGYDDIILYNARDEITETTIANLVFEMDKQFFTPPVSCGLLAGTFRAYLLEQNIIREKTVMLTDLPRCTQIYLINSVRGWQKAELLP